MFVLTCRKKEVTQLERKAQEASTVDEKLSVELQALEMQISMVKYILKRSQSTTSESELFTGDTSDRQSFTRTMTRETSP